MSYANFVRTLFVSHNKELKRFVERKLRDVDDAEDVVQETFQNFIRSEHNEGIENARAYLYRTANNLALNRIRKNKNHAHYIALIEGQDTLSPSLESEYSAFRDVRSVSEKIDKLPPKTQDIFLRSRIQGKKYPEISKELGVSVSTVKKHIVLAMEFLSEALEE